MNFRKYLSIKGFRKELGGVRKNMERNMGGGKRRGKVKKKRGFGI